MDYEKLGFKCGIEIHQQLDTGTKLFCRCPIDLEDESPDGKIQRNLKSVAGETGDQDKAATVESTKERNFVYHHHDRNNCLVELDEEPPHRMNPEALDTALIFARMVGADVPREIQVMRKMVVDGSNTSGFQRTSMVGLDGQLETELGSIDIEDIELEEESAGINKRTKNEAVYDLSRLGVPLVEVGTDASIKSPEHAKEAAEKIGMLLRSTGKARRGIGTIRQDVNVSIDEGSRVEIKGFQDVKNIDTLIENEVERQKNLVELGDTLGDREVLADNVTHIFENTDNQIISTVLENNGSVYAFKLPELDGKLKQTISSQRYLALELVDYAKSRGIQGILHTDEDKSYSMEEEIKQIKDIFKVDEEDAVAVLAGPKDKAKRAAKAVRDRANQVYEGVVPEETRNAEQDITTSYSRPLPGSARMYPETDIPPVEISQDKISEIDDNIPQTLDEREQKYAEQIGDELASQIIGSHHLRKFEKFKEKTDPKLVANIFVNITPRLEAEGLETSNLGQDQFKHLFEALENDRLAKGDVEKTLVEMCEKPESPSQVVDGIVENKSSEDDIREAVEKAIDENEEMIEQQGMHAQGALMGQVMQEIEATGEEVSAILEESLEDYV